jgi:hypothetical protein
MRKLEYGYTLSPKEMNLKTVLQKLDLISVKTIQEIEIIRYRMEDNRIIEQ